MGIVPESDLQKALAFQVVEEILELFTWPQMKQDFIRGDVPEDVFDQEDRQSRVALISSASKPGPSQPSA